MKAAVVVLLATLIARAPDARAAEPPEIYAVVIGHKITNELAQKLVSSLNVDIGFFMDNADVASSNTIALDHAPMLEALKTLKGGDLSHDCQANHPLDLHAGALAVGAGGRFGDDEAGPERVLAGRAHRVDVGDVVRDGVEPGARERRTGGGRVDGAEAG